MDNQLTHKLEGEFQVFTITGSLQLGETNQYKEILLNEQNKQVKAYVFDFSKLEKVDSTGMGLLITFMKHVEAVNPLIYLIIQDEFIQELFEIAQLDQLFTIIKTLEEIK